MHLCIAGIADPHACKRVVSENLTILARYRSHISGLGVPLREQHMCISSGVLIVISFFDLMLKVTT
jgi:hypothetical protein